MTVTNNGDDASDPEPFTIAVPTGVTVAGVDVGPEGAALRRATAGLLRAGPIGPCAAPDCTVDLPPVAGHTKITVTVTLTASPTASSGSITVTVFGESVTTQLVVTPLPAALDLLNPLITQSPVAGGTGAFTVTVRNTGGQPSTGGEPVTIDLPDGFTPQQILVGDQTCLPTGEAAARVDCALPVIQPGDDVLISVDLRVNPGTKVGIATVSIPNTEPLSVTLTVQRGITGLAGQAQGPLVADGQAHNIVITATTADPSVTNPGTITFTTATTPGVTFTTNEDCTVPEGGTTAECDLFGDNKLTADRHHRHRRTHRTAAHRRHRTRPTGPERHR